MRMGENGSKLNTKKTNCYKALSRKYVKSTNRIYIYLSIYIYNIYIYIYIYYIYIYIYMLFDILNANC